MSINPIRSHNDNLEVYRNTNFEELQNFFDVTQKSILDHQAEILNVKTIEWASPSWTRLTLSHDQVVTWTKGRVRVCSDSVLCLGRVSDHSEANRRWENRVEEFRVQFLQEVMERRLSSSGIFSQDLYHWRSSKRSTKICKIETLNLNILKIQSSSCQCSLTSNGHREENKKNVFQIPKNSKITRRDSLEDSGHSSALETNRNGMELSVIHLKENGIPPPHRWRNDSKKPVTQCSRVSML